MNEPRRALLAGLPPVAFAVAGFHLLLHLLTSGRYGIFRDEFYYLACADHLDWGYVDHPPLSIGLLFLQRAVLGDSIQALRVLPALAGALLVLLAAALARALGGGRFAQGLAALCTAIVPQYLVLTGHYSMNAFDLLVWAGAALLVIRIVETGDDRLWIGLGALLGVGLLNKISPVFFGVGLVAGIALTPLRHHIRRPRLWLGGLLAAVLFLPHVLWQVAHGWPTLEFIQNATRYKNAEFSVAQFALAQLPEIHPFLAPVWLGGLLWLLADKEGRRFRVLGIVYLGAFALMAAQKGKPYYLGPAYPMLLAAGACAIERLTAGGRARAWARPAVVGAVLVGGATTLPLVVPVLEVEALLAYSKALGRRPTASEKKVMGPLPQYFADRFGWEEMARAVASVYSSLPPEERAGTVIFTANYGEAGALRYYGRGLGLPPAVSQHNNFLLWGPGSATGEVVITVGIPAEDLRDAFRSIEVGPRLDSPYAMPHETEHPILVCRGLRRPLAETWRHHGRSFI